MNNYVYIVRDERYIRAKQAAYYVGFSRCQGLSARDILDIFPSKTEIVLVQQLDEEFTALHQARITDAINGLFPMHPDGGGAYIADPWAIRSVIHSTTSKKESLAFTEKLGSTEPGSRLGYIYLLRLTGPFDQGVYKVGKTEEKGGSTLRIKRLLSYKSKEIVLIAQVNNGTLSETEDAIKEWFQGSFETAYGTEHFYGNWKNMVTTVNNYVLSCLVPFEGTFANQLPDVELPDLPNTPQLTIANFIVRYIKKMDKPHFQVSHPTLRDEFRKEMKSIVNWSNHESEDRIYNYIMGFENKGCQLRLGFPSSYHTFVISSHKLLYSIQETL